MEKFRPGFRLSKIDVAVVIVGILSSVLVTRFDESFAVIILFTIAHFFLLCNVLRMIRVLELVWAVLFVLLAATSYYAGYPPLSYTLCGMLVVTAILSTIQMLRPSYHGVLWRRINPDLPQWWSAKEDKEA